MILEDKTFAGGTNDLDGLDAMLLLDQTYIFNNKERDSNGTTNSSALLPRTKRLCDSTLGAPASIHEHSRDDSPKAAAAQK